MGRRQVGRQVKKSQKTWDVINGRSPKRNELINIRGKAYSLGNNTDSEYKKKQKKQHKKEEHINEEKRDIVNASKNKTSSIW